MSGVPWGILGKLLLGGIPAVLIGTQLISVVVTAENAPCAVYLACLYRRTAIVAGYYGVPVDTQDEGRPQLPSHKDVRQ